MSEDAKHTALYEWGKIRNRNRPRAPSMAETVAFGDGFDAAMKFMASPRIPAYTGDIPALSPAAPVDEWVFNQEKLPPSMPNPPKEHNPHGLVAFYTDAPNV